MNIKIKKKIKFRKKCLFGGPADLFSTFFQLLLNQVLQTEGTNNESWAPADENRPRTSYQLRIAWGAEKTTRHRF